MGYRDGHFQDLKVPLTLTVGIAIVVAAVVAIALLISDRRETVQSSAYGLSRTVADTVSTPLGEVVAIPGRWGSNGINFIRGYLFAASENRRLRTENAELRKWQSVAVALQDTNERYKALLGLKMEPPIPMIAGRVVLDSRGPFANTRLADVGKEKGVAVGNPVMSETGLIGRVIGVTRGASRIMLLTDIASRTPVLINRTDARAMLAGDSSTTPRLAYLRGQNAVRDGDRILTSGDGGVFPRGLPVGTAVRGLDGVWRVRLDSDAAPIDFVRILLFKDFTQLVDQKDLTTVAMPPVGSGGPAPVVSVPALAPPAPPHPATARRPPTPSAQGDRAAAPPPPPAVSLQPAAAEESP